MIKLIKDSTKKNDFYIEIDGERVEDVVAYERGSTIRIEVSYKTIPRFFLEKNFNNFQSLLVDYKLFAIVVYDFANELIPREVNDLFIARPTNFDLEDKNKIDKEDEKEKESDVQLILGNDKSGNIIASISSLSLLVNHSWKNSFSMNEYLALIVDKIFSELKYKNKIPYGRISFPVLNNSISLADAIKYTVDKFKVFHAITFEKLTKDSINSLETRFSNFPEEVRIPCEQYLLYFAEFLRDLGISATADIKHEAGEILFSITPNDPNQALDKIKVALDAFLKLPKSEIIISPDKEFEIAMLKAKANIDHLNSQLSLAKAEIRLKEREIQAIESTLETKDIAVEFLREKLNQQKRLLNGEIAEGIIDVAPNLKVEDKEEFFDGVFALTQYEEKGFRVNLAQLYRKLRDYLKKE